MEFLSDSACSIHRPPRSGGALLAWAYGLCIGLSVLTAPAQAQGAKAAEAPKAETPAEVVRPELGVIFQSAQDLLKAGNAPGALSALAAADALADKTPYEVFSLNRVRGTIALVARDFGMARRALEPIAADPRLSPNERRSVLQSLVAASQRLNDHPAAVRFAKEFYVQGGQGEAVRGALVRSLFVLKQWPAVDQEAQRVVREAEAAGRAPEEELLKVWATARNETKNDSGYFEVVELLVRHHPSPDYWGDLLSRLQNRPGFADRLLIDAYRLMRRTESLVDEGEYMALAQLTLQAALPAEASAVLEAGFAAGVLGKGVSAAAHRDLRAKVSKAASDDKAQWAQSSAALEKAGDPNRLFALGEAALSYGETDKGLALMERARGLPGLRQPGDAALRHGAALLLAGRKAQGLEILKGVQGADGLTELARLWPLAVR